MNRFFLTLAILAVSAVSAVSHAGEWKPLFNADLSNAQYTPGIWSVDADGVLSATQDSAIWAVGNYENFELSLEFKNDNGTNSGVVVYCTDIQNWIPNSVEIQIQDDSKSIADGAKPVHQNCGAIYGHLAPSKLVVKKPGEWNTMHIVCKGRNIQVTVNGEKVTDMDMTKWTSGKTNPDGTVIPPWLPKPFAEIPTKGSIGFQGKHGQSFIYFRNIQICDAE
ncbi:MAG: DUF1080 domain-containing protein [Thermoguttaceae bacterium]|nr:DUF1080 domain-containing protein [Thermoguttaceae bacterium]